MDLRSRLVLYDISSVLPNQAWSLNTWKIRFALNIKKIPYETRWLSHSQIEPEMRRIGAAPTTHFFSGTQRYTLPAIFDPRSGTAISDSSAILFHLEQHYPETPSLIPPGTGALQRAFVATSVVPLERAIFPLVVLRNAEILLPESRVEWRERREHWLGERLEDVAPPGTKRDAMLAVVLRRLDNIDLYIHSGKNEAEIFVTGRTVSYCDIAIAGALIWMRILLGEESSEWVAVMGANNGRWKRLMSTFKQWEAIERC